MKKIKFITYAVFVLLLGFAISSCKGDDGPAGADGIDGVNGADGNANVATVSMMATDITWTTGVFIGIPSNVYSLNTTAVDQDIIDHGAVLGFVYTIAGGLNIWGPLPFDYDVGAGTLYIAYTYELNNITLYAYGYAGAWDPNPAFTEYRFLLVTDNTVSKTTTKESILEELKNAGIDANNYYEVCDYFGIDPE